MDIAKRFPQLPENVLRRMIDDICDMLPAPEPDTPENRERFRQAAINEFVALDPFDIFDAMAAKDIIICEALAWDCSRNAAKAGGDLRLLGPLGEPWCAITCPWRRACAATSKDGGRSA